MIHLIGKAHGREYWECRCCGEHWVTAGDPEIEHCCAYVDRGPGTELAKSFARLGLSSCGACEQLKFKMNEWGPVGCRQRLELIVSHIAARSRIPFAALGVRAMVERAITRWEVANK